MFYKLKNKKFKINLIYFNDNEGFLKHKNEFQERKDKRPLHNPPEALLK